VAKGARVLSTVAGLSCLAAAVGLLHTPSRAQESSGITVERYRAPVAPEVAAGDRRITIVRVDPARFELRFLTTMHHGEARTLPEWVRDFELAGGINAGMFLPGGRPLGHMQFRGEVWSARRPRNHEAVIAFDPLSRPGRAFAIGGAGCGEDLDAMRTSFGSLLQARRLLVDCAGRPTRWQTARYSAAAIGVDRDGRVVLVHSRTPYRMAVLARMLAAEELGIRGLAYMEGGPEASLVVSHGSARVREIGSWEDGFNLNDDNRVFWDLPNVIGFAPR
jgi:uncharacterized protein YigE (DUF2233 family)